MARTYDVSQLIDERGISAFSIRLVIFTFFVVLFDGYDITAMAFAAPSLIAEWHVDRAALGMHVPIQQLFVIAALPFVVGAVACFVLARLYFVRFQGSGLRQRDALERAA